MGTTAEKLTYLNATKTLIKDNLNLGGANISNEPFRVYSSKLIDIYKDFLANGTDTLWNNWNKVNGTGTDLNLSPTLEARLGLIPRGNTSQDGEPTPDSPQDINVVSGDNSIKVEGKNLLPNTATTTTTNGITFTANEDGTISVSGTASSTAYLTYPTFSLSAGTYTLSAGIYVNQLTRIQLVEDITNRPLLASTQSSANQTFTTTATKRVFLQFRINSGEVINTTFKPMIEKGSTATEYEEHKEQNYTLSLGDIELVEIGDYADYIEGTPDNWVKKEVIGKIILDGSENWARYATGTADKYRFRFQNEEFVLNDSASNIVPLLCNKFTSVSPVNTYRLINGICRDNQPYLFIYWEDWSEWTVAQLKSELANNNIIVYGPLATPTDVPITDTTLINQLNALYYARSYDDETNISTSCEDGNMPIKINASSLRGDSND